ELVRDCVDPRDRTGVAALGGVQQVLGLVAELVQVGTGRQVRHDVSHITPWSAAGPEESVIIAACPCLDGGGLCPARGPRGGLLRLPLIVSGLAARRPAAATCRRDTYRQRQHEIPPLNGHVFPAVT